MRLHLVYGSGLLLACASIAPAQVVTEIGAPTVPTTYIDMDAVGPVGPTSVAAINAAGAPTLATIQNISLTPSAAANPGVYNTNPSCIRALGLAYPSGVGLELLDSSAGQFTSFNARIDLGGPSTEFGVGIGDWVAAMILDFYSANALVTSATSSTYANCNQKFFQMSGGTFDRVDIRASTTGGNWVITELSVQVLNGLYASFSATPSSGPTPLNVQFTDRTFTSDPAGVQNWAWDLDGDSIVDSNAPNPRFTYSTCGYYDVTLTVTDTQHPASTRTANGFIQADPQLLVVTDFSFVGGGVPLSIAFTDTSIGNPTSWSWDFDGDNVPDSVQRNPTWAYSAGGTYTVTLAASNACGAGTVRKQVNVIGNDECVGAIPLTLGLSPVYTNQGSTTSSGWPCALGGNDIWFSYRSSCNGSLEINTCTGSSYDTSLEVFSGTCGGLTSVFCNDDFCGLQSSITFPVASSTTYYLRVGGYNSAQGSFQLNTILNSSGNGNFTNLFAACGGANLATTGTPNIGGSISFTATPASGLPFIMIGSVPLGVPICPAGCMIGHNMDVVLPGASFQTNIPCWPFLIGGQVYFQAIELGTAGGCTVGSPAQLVTTNTVRATIG